MSSIALSFNNVDLTPIDNGDGQTWFTAKQLAEALGYADDRAVSRIYNKHDDEFTPSMTALVNTTTPLKTLGLATKTRVFSLRGCHLIAMFARSKVAKDFRVWVLNVLDAHVANDLNKGYQLGSLQSMRDENRARYAVGFTVAGQGGKVLNSWKHEKSALDSELQVIDNLMQPLLTGFNDAKLIK